MQPALRRELLITIGAFIASVLAFIYLGGLTP